MILEHVIAACGEASSQGPETTARISALLYPMLTLSVDAKRTGAAGHGQGNQILEG